MRLPAVTIQDNGTVPRITQMRRLALMFGVSSLLLVWPLGWVPAIAGLFGVAVAFLLPSGKTLKALHEADYHEMLTQAQTEAREEIRQAGLKEDS